MTDRGIPAIETRYAGHRFRSRTEARWAIYFDYVGLKWEYEPQGVELPSGRYLPDFYLPQCEAWFEVKGSWDQVEDTSRFHELALESRRCVLVAADRPILADQIQVFSPEQKLITLTDPRVARSAYLMPLLGQFGAAGSALGILPSRPWALGSGPEYLGFLLTDKWDGPEGPFVDAVNAAQNARFEHGEQHNNGPWR